MTLEQQAVADQVLAYWPIALLSAFVIGGMVGAWWLSKRGGAVEMSEADRIAALRAEIAALEHGP